ncbi:hypothetical protein [Streptomyces sp. NPDC001635]
MRTWKMAVLGAVLGVSLAGVSVGQAQAAEHASHLAPSAQSAVDSHYTARETRPVYESPDRDAAVTATVLEGEIITASSEVVQGPDGTDFRYAWTYNYTTGHFFRGYVEADNLTPYL